MVCLDARREPADLESAQPSVNPMGPPTEEEEEDDDEEEGTRFEEPEEQQRIQFLWKMQGKRGP